MTDILMYGWILLKVLCMIAGVVLMLADFIMPFVIDDEKGLGLWVAMIAVTALLFWIGAPR